eukprot:TsM_000206600 transcript=TsM_000206600 gene=TsM_000206600
MVLASVLTEGIDYAAHLVGVVPYIHVAGVNLILQRGSGKRRDIALAKMRTQQDVGSGLEVQPCELIGEPSSCDLHILEHRSGFV